MNSEGRRIREESRVEGPKTQAWKSVLEAGEWNRGGYISKLFTQMHTQGTKEGDEWAKIKGRAEKQNFKLAWVRKMYEASFDDTTEESSKIYKKTDWTAAEFLPLGRIIVEQGGFQDPTAVKAGVAWVTKCCLMGKHMRRWNEMTDRWDFLYTSHKTVDEFTHEWKRHKFRRVQRLCNTTASGSDAAPRAGVVPAVEGAAGEPAAGAPDAGEPAEGVPGEGAPGQDDSDRQRRARGRAATHKAIGKAKSSPKSKAKGKGKGKSRGWNKASDTKDMGKEAQKTRTDYFELVTSADHLIKKVKSDPNWEWARNDHVVGYLENSMAILKELANTVECNEVLVAQSMLALKDELEDKFEERMAPFVGLMGPKIQNVKRDRDFLFSTKDLRNKRAENADH